MWAAFGHYQDIPPLAFAVPAVFAKSSPLYNPLVYLLLKPNFRQDLHSLLLACVCVSGAGTGAGTGTGTATGVGTAAAVGEGGVSSGAGSGGGVGSGGGAGSGSASGDGGEGGVLQLVCPHPGAVCARFFHALHQRTGSAAGLAQPMVRDRDFVCFENAD